MAGEPNWAAGLRIHHVQYTYADDGQPDTVTAYSYASGTQVLVAQNTFTYNDLRDLTGEAQAHLGSVGAGTPTVAYDWAFSPLAAYNFHRLTGITYPARQGQGSGRTVALDYGNNTTDLDSALSRVTKLTDSALGELGAFTYAGSGRRVGRTFGGGTVAQSVAGGGGYTGLDRFGRVIDLDYTGSGGTLQRYQYGYDAAGNRLYAQITQVNHDNDRSYLYRYDALSRLILAERGQITPSASGGTIDTGGGAPMPEARLWRLDNLGNWAGGEVFEPPHNDGTDGSLAWGPDVDGNGVPDAGAAWTHHDVDRSNRITEITKDTGAGPEPDYDLAGNLVSDGEYFLQYDGFNRLVQVNQIGTATLNANGEVTGGSPGDIVVQFVYDGLGRLIRSIRPDRTEDHYYDGVRRIQTDVTIDDTTDTDRQYVYGPDYVDEFVAQIDSAGAVFYMLQDGNYNVVALVNASGVVVEQYAYRPYGGLVAVDSLGSAPVNTAGHQGLFYEHIDGGTGLSVNATGFYYNRNRFYSPALGRFLQRDPNETAMPLLTAMAYNGQTLSIPVGAFDPEWHFDDGMNVYLYLGANPPNGSDPSGLYDPFKDVDEAVAGLALDYFIVRETLNEVKLNARRGLRLANLYMQAAFAWDELVWDEGESALFGLVAGGFFARACFEEGTPVWTSAHTWEPIEDIRLGDSVFSDPAQGLPPVGFNAASTDPADPDTYDQVDPSTWIAITLKFEDPTRGTVIVSLLRPSAWIDRFKPAVGGWVDINMSEMGISGAATVVEIAGCPTIRNQAGCRTVTGVFTTERSLLLDLALNDEDSPIGLTSGHPLFSADRDNWVGAKDLRPGECLRTRQGTTHVRSAAQRPGMQRVYNLEIHRDHTYYVGKTGVWVHNGCVKPDWVKSRDTFCSWMKNLQEAAKAAARKGQQVVRLTVEEATDLVRMARQYGAKVTVDAPHSSNAADAPWDEVWHLHVGDGRFHVPCPDGFTP